MRLIDIIATERWLAGGCVAEQSVVMRVPWVMQWRCVRDADGKPHAESRGRRAVEPWTRLHRWHPSFIPLGSLLSEARVVEASEVAP